MTRGGAFESFESTDGKYLYYSNAFPPWRIWRVRLRDGVEEPVEGMPALSLRRCWALSDEGVYFSQPIPGATGTSLRRFEFATREVVEVGRTSGPLAANPGCMDVSPDGRTLLYSQVDRDERDIMMVEGFE